jgi:hypothetical protein
MEPNAITMNISLSRINKCELSHMGKSGEAIPSKAGIRSFQCVLDPGLYPGIDPGFYLRKYDLTLLYQGVLIPFN